MTTATLPALVQQYFTDRLCTQLAASPNTIAAYRDTFRLLLQFASEQTGKPPTKLTVEQVDVTLVGDLLTHLEEKRGNSARSQPGKCRLFEHVLAVDNVYRHDRKADQIDLAKVFDKAGL